MGSQVAGTEVLQRQGHLLPYHCIGLSFSIIGVSLKLQIGILDKVSKEVAAGLKGLRLVQCSCFVVGVTLPSLRTCPLLVLQSQTRSVNSSTAKDEVTQRPGANFFSGAKTTRIGGTVLKIQSTSNRNSNKN